MSNETAVASKPLPNTCKACCGCPYSGPKVGGRGNPAAPLVFIAEAPGVEELRTGVAVSGPSGKLFWDTFPSDEVLAEWGIDKEQDILVLNALQCRPPTSTDAAKNVKRVHSGMIECHDRLMAEIKEHPRKLIVTMGNHALHSVTGNHGLKITQIRGALLPSEHAELGLLPVVHPAALLRGTGNYRQFRNDIRYAIDLFRGVPPKRPVRPKRHVCRTVEEAIVAIWDLRRYKELACDTETEGFDYLTQKSLSLGIAGHPALVYIFPEHVMWVTERLFRRTDISFIWHNGKFDMHFVRRHAPSARVDEDTMLESYTLDESGGIHDLEQVSGDLIGAPDYKGMLKPYLPNKKASYGVIPKNVLYEYQSYDVSNTLQIHQVMRPMVREDKHLEKLYTRTLIPASEMLYWVEERGIEICRNRVDANRKRLEKIVEAAYKEIQLAAAPYIEPDSEINPASPLQLANLLYDRMKLKPPRHGERGTGKEILPKLPQLPVVKAIGKYRRAAKLLSTYVTSLENAIRIDGRVHTMYKIHGTRTGRLASGNLKANSIEYPMQVIPRESRIRGMFYAGRGRVFIRADLNQAELRCLAHYSRDKFLCGVYNDPNGKSLHDEVATEFFGVGFNKEDKMIAKNINFGIVYGITCVGLAEQIKKSKQESAKYIERWFARCPEAKAFIDKCRGAVTQGATIITVFGRKKRHWIVTRENLNDLQNEASNFPHQSTASDITLHAAIRVAPILRERDVWICNVVHDEIIADAPDNPEVIAWAKKVITDAMRQVPVDWGLTRVPFKSEADVGRRWSIYRKEAKRAKAA